MRVMSEGFPGPGEGPEQYLRALELAEGVKVERNGKRVDSADLLLAGEFELVANRLWALERRSADAENNLGCASAWLKEWDAAVAALERSASASGADAARARRNLDQVARARTVA